MAELRLAGNLITPEVNNEQRTTPFGHLQVVLVKNNGAQLEIEVQAPDNLFLAHLSILVTTNSFYSVG